MKPAMLPYKPTARPEQDTSPIINILLPFDPKITARDILNRRLEMTLDKVRDELDRHYPREMTYMLMQRLRKLVGQLNFATYRKSIVIYVSAVIEKVIYLDIDVEERIFIDGHLSMRNVVMNKKDNRNFLLLMLSAERIKIFHGTEGGLKRILSATPDSMGSFRHDLPERVANFSDPSSVKEVMLDKFMRYADHSLRLILTAYPFPVIVLAAERTGGHFRKITANDHSIISYIHGNYEDASEKSLLQLLSSSMDHWEKLRQQHLFNLVEKAMGAGKLAMGVRDVCKEASLKKGQLMILEKGLPVSYVTESALDKGRLAYLHDKMDEAMINVFESGGDVELVEDGALGLYKGVVLIKYY